MARSTPFVGLGRTRRDIGFTPYSGTVTQFQDFGGTTGNVNPGGATNATATLPTATDAGAQAPRQEQFTYGGAGGSDRPEAPRRDLAENPLTPNEVRAANFIADNLGRVAGPLGTVAGSLISGNLGYNGYATPGSLGRDVGLAGATGRNMGLGYSFPEASGKAAAGWAMNDSGYGLTAMDRNQIDRGALNPASIEAQLTANAVEVMSPEQQAAFDAETRALGDFMAGSMGYTPGQISAMQDQDQQFSLGPPAATSAADAMADATYGSTGYNTGLGISSTDGSRGSDSGGRGADSGPSGGNSSGDNGQGGTNDGMGPGGVGGWKDGGIVGLSAPRYADGGLLGGATMNVPPQSGGTLATMGFASGGSVPLGATQGGPGMGQAEVEGKMAMMLKNPQVVQKLRQIVTPAMQSGQLTPQELQMLGQIATACMANPGLYPRLRQFATSNGVTNLPPAYDQKVIITLIAVSKIMGGQQGGQMQPGGPGETPPGQVPPTSQAQMVNPTGAPDGGMLMGPGTGRSDSIGTQNLSTGGPVKVSNGEYVIPKHVVDAKGREFFDNLLRRYADLGGDKGAA